MTTFGPWVQPADAWRTASVTPGFLQSAAARGDTTLALIAAGSGRVDDPLDLSTATQLFSAGVGGPFWSTDVQTYAWDVGAVIDATSFPPASLPALPAGAESWEIETPQGTPTGPLRLTVPFGQNSLNVTVPEEVATSLRVRQVPTGQYAVVGGTLSAAYATSSTLLSRSLIADLGFGGAMAAPVQFDLDLADLDADRRWVVSHSISRLENVIPWATGVTKTIFASVDSIGRSLAIFYRPPRYRAVFTARTPLRGRQRTSGVTGNIPLRGRNQQPYGLRGRQNADL